ncbi:MAG: aminotransferase class I/II-fold pyridoxal phosphate-dependent enzyme, partial [Clostridia bacterium]|nr:aminotransferase class I/II-fold pyridoxal phosphate-dependent enzyme [Clostridia bacterium]
MDIRIAERLSRYETGIFASLDLKKEALIKAGRKVYNLSVGTPDFKPEEHIIQALVEAAKNPDNYKYSLRDLPELKQAVADYYQKHFGTVIEPDEVMSIYGSQEGMAHIGLCLCNPGDIVLLPDPGYPIFEVGSRLGQAEIVYYPLLEENNFLPHLDQMDEEILKRTRYIIVSYPSNPTGAVAPVSMYTELIEYAKKYNFIIIHDNAYSEIIYDEHRGISFLSLPGAKEVGVEFFSLSKTFNLTGARVSFVIGNKQVLNALNLLRSQIDYGMFYPIQYAAIAALSGSQEGVEAQRLNYQARRDALCGGFRRIGWEVPNAKGTMFVWAKIPPKFQSSKEFCEELMDKTGVICTPGGAFGALGEGYVRFALVL